MNRKRRTGRRRRKEDEKGSGKEERGEEELIRKWQKRWVEEKDMKKVVDRGEKQY